MFGRFSSPISPFPTITPFNPLHPIPPPIPPNLNALLRWFSAEPPKNGDTSRSEGSGHESPQNRDTGGKDSASSGSGHVPNGDIAGNDFAQNRSRGSDDGRSDDEFKFNTTFDTMVWINL
ncbi:uncharacterized protein LOC132303047 isoform X2 [Cornus florida]|uniref:uncharacterized protein LOC132303047 isoform X2 n=1 Tax=Cornus florida TaxID=4283 RepID=UPI0028996EEB|nr:uncharacterized protein LOC132303047 isoform X2 [Cornus florida]